MSKFYRRSTFTIDGNYVKKLDEFLAGNSDKNFEEGYPLVYNIIRRAVESSRKIDLDELNTNTAIVNELYVNGTAHINDTEEHEVQGDYLTLRANNNSAIANGKYSGILINHYNSNGDLLAIVVDHTGTARLGTGSGTPTTYSNLYYAISSNKYYTDIEDPSTEVEPQGMLIEWSSYEKTDSYEHWTDAKWVIVDFSDTKPFLLREESSALVDKALLAWDATNERAFDIPLPTINGQKLVATVTPDPLDPTADPTITYGWGGTQEPSTFIFDTVEDYETALLIPEGQAGYIPSKSHIIIRGNYDTVLGA